MLATSIWSGWTDASGGYWRTFDPPHIVHLILAAEALHQLRLDRLLWVLTPNPPHKQSQVIAPLPLRLEMAQAAIQNNPSFELSRVDIDRQPPHYALDTVQLLHEQYPGAEIIYIIGSDSLKNLPTWYRCKDLLAACDGFGVMRRPFYVADLSELENLHPASQKITYIDAPLLAIASSEIRQRIHRGVPIAILYPRGSTRSS